jgi:hypothetical protein
MSPPSRLASSNLQPSRARQKIFPFGIVSLRLVGGVRAHETLGGPDSLCKGIIVLPAEPRWPKCRSGCHLSTYRSPGHHVEAGSLADIVVARRATRWLRLYNPDTACSAPIHGSASPCASQQGLVTGRCYSCTAAISPIKARTLSSLAFILEKIAFNCGKFLCVSGRDTSSTNLTRSWPKVECSARAFRARL